MSAENWDALKTVLSGLVFIISLVSLRQALATAVTSKRPMLAFLYDGRAGWTIRNLGSGPALNIVVAQKRPGGDWFDPRPNPTVGQGRGVSAGVAGARERYGFGGGLHGLREPPLFLDVRQ